MLIKGAPSQIQVSKEVFECLNIFIRKLDLLGGCLFEAAVDASLEERYLCNKGFVDNEWFVVLDNDLDCVVERASPLSAEGSPNSVRLTPYSSGKL